MSYQRRVKRTDGADVEWVGKKYNRGRGKTGVGNTIRGKMKETEKEYGEKMVRYERDERN